jgi:hypothetical protein
MSDAWKQRMVAEGRCNNCGAKKDDGETRRRCTPCRARAVASVTAYNNRNDRAGCCPKCGLPREPDCKTKQCSICARKSADSYAQWRQRRKERNLG